MIRIEGLEAVMHRVQELNIRFGIEQRTYNKQNAVQEASSKTFAQELQEAKEAKEAKGTSYIPKNKDSVSTGDSDTNTILAAMAKRYQVDPRLAAAVAQVESNGRQEAVSSAGAIGVMQLMPGTAQSLGVDPYDKQQNIEGGVKYLRQLLDTFGGDVAKAVAAYNAGPQAVKNYNGIPPYGETQNYVNKVLDIYR